MLACLRMRAIAGHQRRGGEAEHLPEREIPRHHRQHDAERIEGHERLAAANIGRLVGEIFVGVVGEPVAVDGAFLDLGAAVVERFPHFLGHQPGELVLPRAQNLRGLADRRGARLEGGPPPLLERPMRRRRRGMGFVDAVRMVGPARLAGRGVDRLERVAAAASGKFELVGHPVIPPSRPPRRRSYTISSRIWSRASASRNSLTSALLRRNSSRSSGPKPLTHSTEKNAARISGSPRNSCRASGRR